MNEEELKKLDNQIINAQRSTRTELSFMQPIHEALRLKYPSYYKWSSNPVSGKIHGVFLSVYLLLVMWFIGFSTLAPLSKPIMASDIWTETSDSDFNAGVLNSTDVNNGSVIISEDIFSYKKTITIDNTAGGELIGYQAAIELDNTNFDFSKTQSDGDDIRFLDSDDNTSLDYWVEEWDSGAETALVWVNVPLISASSTKNINFYYGNSLADSIENGENTFEFFDDFSDGDMAGWTASGGTWAVADDGSGSNNVLNVSTTGTDQKCFFDASGLDNNYIYHVEAYKISGSEGFLIPFDVKPDNVQPWWNIGGWGNTQSAVEGIDGTAVADSVNTDQWYSIDLSVAGDLDEYEGLIDKVSQWSGGVVTDSTPGDRTDGMGVGSWGSAAYFDNIYVRQYTANIPSISLGSESSVSKSMVASSSSFISQAYDTNKISDLETVYWTATVPAGNTLKFQIRSSQTEAGLSSANWYGPIGTSDYYETSGSSINSVHNGDVWVQYKAFFTSNDISQNSSLDSVSIEYSLASLDIETSDIWAEANYTVNNLTITNAATLTLEGGSTLNVLGDLTIDDSAGASYLICEGKNTTSNVGGIGCNINVVGNVVVDTNSAISADAQGYETGYGPGRAETTTDSGSGGSYGGFGEAYDNGLYGSVTEPIDLGSAGGAQYLGGWSRGGGAIKLNVTGNLALNGEITADGETHTAGNCAGGSGGSIWISANNISGTGSFTANGDPGLAGSSGGGGRVAIYYSDISGFSGDYTATEGDSDATEGSVVLIEDENILTVTSNTRFETDQSSWLGIKVDDNANLYLGGGVVLETIGDILVTGSSNIICEGTNTTADADGVGCEINAQNIQIDSGSAIDADGQGYETGHGPGRAETTTDSGSGGSYGGFGEAYDNGTYGSAIEPVDLGSAGGAQYNGGWSKGGGAIKLVASSSLTVNGDITSDGTVHTNGNCAGGSGGSIWIDTNVLNGSGSIGADGSPGLAAVSGGGGRVAIYYIDLTGFSGSVTANQGGAGSTDGSVILIDDYNLIIESDLVFTEDQDQWNSITVQGGANLTIEGGLEIDTNGLFKVTGNSTVTCEAINTSLDVGGEGVIIKAENLQVDSGSIITADGQGYETGHGPGRASAVNDYISGGSYGGHGENYDNGIYGSEYQPYDLGSAGGAENLGGWSRGGGAIKIEVDNDVTINGEISADGKTHTSGNCAGGSGGSIWVKSRNLLGAGTISADGADGLAGGAGGGGRVAMFYYSENDGSTCSNMTITADKGDTGATDGTTYCGASIPTQFLFTNSSQTLSAGQSGQYTIALRDEVGTARIAVEDVSFNLISMYVDPEKIYFSTDGSNWERAIDGEPTIVIPAGSSFVSFYCKSEIVGNPNIRVYESGGLGYGVVDQLQTIVAATVNKFDVVSLDDDDDGDNQTEEVVAGQSTRVYILAQDQYGNTVTTYNGIKDLYFAGANPSPSGTYPTARNKYGIDIDFGDVTKTTFTNGRSSNIYITPYKVEEGYVIVTSSQGLTNNPNIHDDDSLFVDLDVIASEGDNFVFTTDSQTVESGELSEMMSVKINDSYFNNTQAEGNISVLLDSSSDTGIFYSDANGENIVDSVNMNSGASSVNFWYKDYNVGNPVITVNADNVNSTTQTQTVVDTTAPESPVVTYPTEGLVITDTDQPTIIGTSEPNSTVIISIGENNYSVTANASGEFSYQIPASLSNGSYILSVFARDGAGNDSGLVSVNFSINYTSIVSTSPIDELEDDTEDETKEEGDDGMMTVKLKVDRIDFQNFSNELKVLPEKAVTVYVDPGLDKKVNNVAGYFNYNKYDFELAEDYEQNEEGDLYKGLVYSPSELSRFKLKVAVTYDDGEIEQKEIDILVDPFGYVYEDFGGSELRLKDVEVTCWLKDDGQWVTWEASKYDQENPQNTKKDGSYSFMVPIGTYKISASKDGYFSYESDELVVSEGNPINLNIKLNKIDMAGTIDEIVDRVRDNLEKVRNVFEPIIDSSPVLSPTKNTTNVLAATSVILASSAPIVLNLPLVSPLGQFFAWILSLFGIKTKRKNAWGKVFDATSGQPIQGATVQIFDAKKDKLMESQITDIEGNYGFAALAGEYYIKVIKSDYSFPSKLKSEHYQGGEVTVTEKSVPTMDIPVDPNDKKLTKRLGVFTLISDIFGGLQLPLLVVGFVLAILFAFGKPSIFNWVILFVYVILVFWQISTRFKQVRSLGHVYNEFNRKDISGAIVRLFEHDTKKLLSTKLTNFKGNFYLLAPKGTNHVTITKAGYNRYTSKPEKYSKSKNVTKKYGIVEQKK